MIDRRKIIALLGGTILAWPRELPAQEPGRTYHIGDLLNSPRDEPFYIALYDELGRLGFVEGRNLQIDGQGHGMRREQLAQHAAELVKAKVDVILASGNLAIRAAQQATATIPILGFTDDMVGSGLVSSMAHPAATRRGSACLPPSSTASARRS